MKSKDAGAYDKDTRSEAYTDYGCAIGVVLAVVWLLLIIGIVALAIASVRYLLA